MSDTLFGTGDYEAGAGCAVCSSTEHATAQCWAGQALTFFDTPPSEDARARTLDALGRTVSGAPTWGPILETIEAARGTLDLAGGGSVPVTFHRAACTAETIEARRCFCPLDCNCRKQGAPFFRTNYCGCREH
jgi:hypothetical protein